MTTIPQNQVSTIKPVPNELSDFELNTLAVELMGCYLFEKHDDLQRVIVIRRDGQGSDFNPCVDASHTTEVVHYALFVSEIRFKAQLDILIGRSDFPKCDYQEQVEFCEQNPRLITLAAVIALREFEEAEQPSLH